MADRLPYYLNIAVKIVVVIGLLLVYTRMSGSRRLAPVTVFDTISNLVVGAIAGTTLLNEKVDVWDLTAFMGIWLMLLLVIRWLRRLSPTIRNMIDGLSIQLIEDGVLDPTAFERAGITPTGFESVLRSRGVPGIYRVDSAIMERGGSLSVVENGDAPFSSIVIDHEEIKDATLKRLGKDRDWLMEELQQHGESSIDNIFCAEWNGERLWLYHYLKEDAAD